MRRIEGSHDGRYWIDLGTIPDNIPEDDEKETKYIEEQGYYKLFKYIRRLKIS